MDDLEKVIRGLECCIKSISECQCADGCPYEDNCWGQNSEADDGDPMYLDLMRDALEALKAQEPKWISVQTGMPPANDLVIVSINDDRGDNDYRYTDTGWYLSEGKCWIVNNEATINVEAWMPFPKPYKPPKEE